MPDVRAMCRLLVRDARRTTDSAAGVAGPLGFLITRSQVQPRLQEQLPTGTAVPLPQRSTWTLMLTHLEVYCILQPSMRPPQ